MATSNETSKLPDYGRRLMPNVVDEIAASDPSRTFIQVPRSNDPEDGWEPVTYGQLANAVDHVAHSLAHEVKADSQEDFPTVAYVGPNDVRYGVLMLAAIKAGCKALFISPRNSLEGQLSLFQKTACKHIWYPESFRPVVDPWIKGLSMKTKFVPPAKEWLAAQPEPFPYNRPFEEARWEPAVVLHTSGSTGIPKPIVVRQGSLAIGDRWRNLPKHQGGYFSWRESTKSSKLVFCPMPLFHAAGIIGFLALATIYYGVPLALGMPDKPLTAELAAQCISLSGVNTALLPPFILEELARDEAGMNALKTLDFVTFGGGNLSRSAGDKLVRNGIRLNNVISSTEHVPYAIYFQPNPDVWHYFLFNSQAMGADWRCHDEKAGIYELWIRRIDPNDPGDQACFYTFPELQEWSTGDLYKMHPTLYDHWQFYGRADNIIVFSTGEKLNPVTIEDTLAGHPSLIGALVCGQDRFQPALILEPATPVRNDEQKRSLIDAVWPFIEEINKSTVAHGRIVRRLVTVSDPEKPFPRTPKGSIQRGLGIKAYAAEIDEVYKDAESDDAEEAAPLDFTDERALTQSIIDLFGSRIGVRDVKPATDFFSLGVDSLQVMSVSNILRSSFKQAGVAIDRDALAPRVIYSNPTPQYLAGHLYVLSKDGVLMYGNEEARERQVFDGLVSKYTKDMPAPRTDKSPPFDDGQTVLLTGTTGSLGAYLLEGLIANSNVGKVIALNRGDDGGKSRQTSVSESRGLGLDFSKVEFLGADLSLPDLGLGPAKYTELLASADRFIHNAWPVNFNMGVASFEPYVRGVRHLIDFSSQASKNVPIIFLSSIGTVNRWTSSEVVPEKPLTDFALADMGYGRSKLAASLILDAAAAQSGIPAASIRVGQIAGPRGQKGLWNKQEYLPSLIASSVHLGVLPKQVGPGDEVDWVPIEDVSGLILDVSGVTVKIPVSDINGYFHCVNPSQASWEQLASTTKKFYGDRISKLVTLEEWIEALDKSAGESTDTSKNPGVKLLDTYKGMLKAAQAGLSHVTIAMQRTSERSPTAQRLGPVTSDLLENWLVQWDY